MGAIVAYLTLALAVAGLFVLRGFLQRAPVRAQAQAQSRKDLRTAVLEALEKEDLSMPALAKASGWGARIDRKMVVDQVEALIDEGLVRCILPPRDTEPVKVVDLTRYTLVKRPDPEPAGAEAAAVPADPGTEAAETGAVPAGGGAEASTAAADPGEGGDGRPAPDDGSRPAGG